MADGATTDTRPWTRCRRTIAGEPCNRQLRDHDQTTLRCPSGTDETFLKHTTRRNQASNSFSREEVEALAFLLQGLREGKDLRVFARSQSAVLLSCERKMQTMRARIKRVNR